VMELKRLGTSGYMLSKVAGKEGGDERNKQSHNADQLHHGRVKDEVQRP
jgi:hypothetical protein